MTILGKEISGYSFTDIDFIERIDEKSKELQNIKKEDFEDNLKSMKGICLKIKEFFNYIFQTNQFDDVPNDYYVLMKNFEMFMNEMYSKQESRNKELTQTFNKYSSKRVNG